MAISQSLRHTLHALTETVVPETAALGTDGWASLERIVTKAIADRPPRMRRQLALFMHAIEWLPLLRYGRPFSQLNPHRRQRFLETLQDSPLLLIRRGFWGLRTLILMGYYTQASTLGIIGYRADPRGWSIRT
ncbi:MAG TPA: gluconate 2-dehydrogenase subunit 3 family protein [Gemmatimonadales bacterium]|nr:gluconate 2-dehydrogenase subunit 3 family protein [Gemmatimonadales bacterium]